MKNNIQKNIFKSPAQLHILHQKMELTPGKKNSGLINVHFLVVFFGCWNFQRKFVVKSQFLGWVLQKMTCRAFVDFVKMLEGFSKSFPQQGQKFERLQMGEEERDFGRWRQNWIVPK